MPTPHKALTLGLREPVPVSLPADRWIVVLVCYLDDSGKKENPVTILAGYAATADQWSAFEVEVERWFAEFDVNTLHAMDLHKSRGEFKDAKIWTVLRKQAFVARICQTLAHHIPLAVCFGVDNVDHKLARGRYPGKGRGGSPHGYCFQMIVNWLLDDLRVSRIARTEGLVVYLEAGHENNPEAELIFRELAKHPDLENVLRSISFVSKSHSRAIQMADLLAFYSRRRAEAIFRAPKAERHKVKVSDMERVVFSALPFRSFVATAFSDKDPPVRYLRDFVNTRPRARPSLVLRPKLLLPRSKRVLVRRSRLRQLS